MADANNKPNDAEAIINGIDGRLSLILHDLYEHVIPKTPRQRAVRSMMIEDVDSIQKINLQQVKDAFGVKTSKFATSQAELLGGN